MASLKTPLEAPTADSKPAARAELSPEQRDKYGAVLERARGFGEVRCDKHPERSGPLSEAERAWLTRECLLRYLRATWWSVDKAARRLLATLGWRRDYGLDGFRAGYISPEQETGKQVIVGFDRLARPCQYLNPGWQNTDASPRQMHHLFYMVERVMDVMPPGVETLSLLINFKPSAQWQNTSVPVATAREVLHVLQNHYPERLGKALIINVPWIVSGFFRLITPLMDPVTRDKLKFNDDMRQYVPPEQLWSADWGGDMAFDYDHAVYWPALHDLCRRRCEARAARWEAAGRQLGESEDYLAGGSDVSVSGFTWADAGEARGEADVDAVEEKLAAARLDADERQVTTAADAA